MGVGFRISGMESSVQCLVSSVQCLVLRVSSASGVRFQGFGLTCFKFSTATVTTAPPGEHTASPGDRRVTAGCFVGGATRRRAISLAAFPRTDMRTAAAPETAEGVANPTCVGGWGLGFGV